MTKGSTRPIGHEKGGSNGGSTYIHTSHMTKASKRLIGHERGGGRCACKGAADKQARGGAGAGGGAKTVSSMGHRDLYLL